MEDNNNEVKIAVGDRILLGYNGYEYFIFNQDNIRGNIPVYEVEVKSIKHTKVILDETC